ncbi:MAG TPA: winged helix-turn-helix domain-containing protein [Thermoanaerobaculia bacterium]|nr:winged helix-turn-helix domain-containing protein [Thermoanaerobaculia bacterium]
MEFHGYRVDTVHRTVTTPGARVVRLEPKAFDLLVYFTEHAGETLSREQLIADVWGGKFVTDDAVMVAVYALRQAFGDSSRSPRFIETIRGRGYRWIGEATVERPALAGRDGGLKPAAPRVIVIAALIATGVAAIVWAVLRPSQAMPSITQTNALVRAHARGLFFSERTTQKELEEARAEFRKAILIDRRFAEPHAALAEVCVRLIEVGSLDAAEREQEARREVALALELAPRLAISQAALASVQFVLDRNFAEAERSFRYAMELDPSLPDIHRRYSYLLGASGRFAQATEQARIATEMEPTSVPAIMDLAWSHLLAGSVDAAERHYRDALQLDPVNVGALIGLGNCLELRGESNAAMQSFRRSMQIQGVPDDVLATYDREYASSGLQGVYAMFLERLKVRPAMPRFQLALFATRAGRKAEALDLLRESARRREPGTLWLAVHPAFAPLRNQREFGAVVASSFQTR